MLNSINLNKVKSYKNKVSLVTDKKVNLIYGLNGAGKSTFSNYLHDRNDHKYKDCSIDGLNSNHELIVYNQKIYSGEFFEADNLKGIFTLSKQNKDAEIKISNALKEIKKLEDERGIKSAELETENLP